MVDINQKEKEILEFWKKDKTFEKSLKKTQGKKEFVFYDGPPFATGLPHYGHLLASIEKDVIPRFWTMKGKHVERIWGWDCHGLPIENLAEKELKINSKDEIEKMGVEKFNSFCRSKVLSYAGEWEKVIQRLGRWVDMKNCYRTMDNSYIETVWWIFKQLWDKKLIYEGEKILMYCPRCSTPLAKSEIAMGDSYQKIKDDTITIKFKLIENLDGKEVFALAWTTTPWTLPANLALTVNPKFIYSYVRDKSDGTIYLIAKELIKKFFKTESDYVVIKELKGKELEGKKYEPLFPYFKNLKNSFRFVVGDFVTAEDGTGIVHTAPAFGEDDYNICKLNKIDFVSPVDERGRLTKEVTDFAGEYIFDANKKIIEFLKKKNKIVKVEKKEHEYPFCYRCDTPLFYKAMPALFVDVQKLKDKLLKSNDKVNWYPEFLKRGRVEHTLETAPDWNISRNRYWAASIPVWKSKSGETKVIGSIDELKKNAINIPKGEIDLHKDFVDKVKIKSEKGEEMTRIPDVFDCWFESGSMPYAQLHYPFENKKEFENFYPADFVSEGLDQTRGWFYTLAVISNALFGKAPFKNVLVNGLILAEDGKKMSKKLNNYPDPNLIFEKYGVDALRFYLISSSVMNADNFNFSEKGVEEIYKKVLLLLYNVNNFYSMYKISGKVANPESKEIIDKWIISRLNSVVKKVSEHMENYNTIKSCVEIKDFVDELSTWYVKLNRERIDDKDENAIKTLEFILNEFSKLIAPIMPFVSEIIFQTIHDDKSSVHLENWPEFDDKKINLVLENKMKSVREIVSAGLRERDKIQIGLKWPLANAKILCGDLKLSDEFQEIIKSQLNVKKLEFRESHANSKEFFVELDSKLNSELEAEGYARELSRNIQEFRKSLGLNKKDSVKIGIVLNKELASIVEKHKKNIEEKTNSSSIKLFIENVTTDKERFKKTTDFKIKEKKGVIGLL